MQSFEVLSFKMYFLRWTDRQDKKICQENGRQKYLVYQIELQTNQDILLTKP
jgi:hypothetical protein